MAKEVNLDKALEKAEVVKTFAPEDMPEPPATCDVPDGWSPIRAMDGDCWYGRVKGWEARYGKKMLPLKYTYDENGNIVLREENENGTGNNNYELY